MISHLRDIHDEHSEAEEKYVIESSLSRLLKENIDEYRKIRSSSSPFRQSIKKGYPAVCDMPLQLLL